MTMPRLMNCAHSLDGWCIECVVNTQNEIDALRARCAAAETDAARYRWLRTVANSPRLAPRVKFKDNWPSLVELDALIDALRTKDKP